MSSRSATRTARRRAKPHRSTCPETGKIRFRDAREATDALQYLLNQVRLADDLGGVHTIRVQRKYACKACRGWHLTSWATPDAPGSAAVALAA
jgi:hypothetical protein